MNKTGKKINVQNRIISIISQNDQDYISLTDMVRSEDGEDHIRNWLRNRNTVEFIGLWETLHNMGFKPVEFDTFDGNDFVRSIKKLSDKTYLGIKEKNEPHE